MKKTTAAEQNRTVAIIGTRGYPSYYGGFETAVRKLAPYLAGRGWNTVVYGRPGAARLNDPARDVRVRLVETRGIETKSLSTLTFGLTSVLHACIQKPDVAIIMNVANGFWLPLLKLRGIPTVVNVDGIEWERAKWGRLAKGIFKLGAHFTARFGNTLVADSIEISRRWKRDFGRSSAFIPYGGDIPTDLPLVDNMDHRGYVLIVARFVPENSIEEFFEAVPEIAEHFPVIIVGSSGYGGPLDEKAESLSRTHQNVHWLGHVSDDEKLLSLWQHCGTYFHGHSVGGTNPALVQAMACGAPTLARDTVYNREVLGPHGRFTVVGPKDIVSSVLELMGDAHLQAEASSNGLSRAATTYSWESVCAAYEAEADKVLKSGHVPARS